MTEQLRLQADFKDNASAGVRKLGKTLAEVKPSHGMAAAQKWMETFHKGADRTVGALRPVSGMLNSVGVGGLAASLSIGEMVKQFRELADSTLTMKELGRQSGMTATQIARLQYAAGKLHVDPSAMSGAIGAWSSKMLQFRTKVGEFYNYLQNNRNGDIAAKILGDSPEKGFEDTLDYLSRIPAAAMKASKSAADAVQIQKQVAEKAGLGDLVPMLGKGPDGLAAAFAEAGREVKPISAELQAAADRFNDSTNRMNQSWENLKNDIGPSVIDPMTKMIDHLDGVLKSVSAAPGDAAALAGVGALGFGAVYARHRMMRGSKLAGGTSFDRAAGEMLTAGETQKGATTTFTEAVGEFRAGVREMVARGGPPTGMPTAEPAKPGVPEVVEEAPKSGILGKGGWKGVGAGVMEGLFGAMIYQAGEQAMDSVLGWTSKDQKTLDHASSLSTVIKDVREQWFGGSAKPSASDKWKAPSAYDREARARGRGLTYDAPNTDGNALHRNDEMPAALTAQELFDKVRDGSKEGIVAGLREMAQEQELQRRGVVAPQVGPGDGGGGRRGGGAGMPNLRYGRPAAGSQYRHGPGAQGGDPGGAFNPQAPTASGTFRPQYKLSDADLDDRVVNTIAGEAVTSNPESIDAVVNNMLNRVGSKGWGPSGNLLQVARAPGQYAGYRQADAKTAQRIRDRIRAIASGGVADNTNGSNAYRASWYHGRWYQQHAADGRVVGGNRFAYEPWTKNGPYAPYPASKTAADAFKAHQKALAGTPPQAHAAGGHIRGAGTGTSDSIPALLSNGEYVVRASAAGQFLPLLHAINGGHLSAFAGGGPVGFGVAKRFYPTSSLGISDAEGRANRVSWRDFFRRPARDGGMGASWATTLGALAMMQGESGRSLNTRLYNYDVNGPSGGVDQLHDVTEGKYAGKLHRLTDAMTGAMLQHVDWQDRTFQQANFRKESTGSMWWAWRKMLAAKTAAGALRAGVNSFENPADHEGEFRRRMPNIVRLAREAAADGAGRRGEVDPVEVNIRHHPHTGRPIVTARAGKGVKLGIRTAPTMRPT